MKNEEIAEFVKSRDEAFICFVKSGKLEKFYKHCEKYGQKLPEDETVVKLGILKAVQECTNISENVKTKAAKMAMKMGFSPFMFTGE